MVLEIFLMMQKTLEKKEVEKSLHSCRQGFAELLGQCANRILNAPLMLLDREIENVLKAVHAYFGYDRVVLWELAENGKTAHCINGWIADGDAPPNEVIHQETLPYIIGRIHDCRELRISRLTELPREADPDRLWLMQCGILSLAVIPLVVNGILRGALSLACVHAEHLWTEDEGAAIRQLSAVFSGALNRKRSHRLYEQRVQFETLMTDLSARLITAPASEIDTHIEQALDQVRRFFNGDRCGLIAVRDNSRFCWVSHCAYGENIPRVSGDANMAERFPWTYDLLVIKGKHKNVSNRKELPPEAEIEFPAWDALGIRSVLAVPIFFEGKVV